MKSFFLLIFSCCTFAIFAQSDCQFSAQITPANCRNEKGRIEMTVVDGMPPFQYEWSANAETKNRPVAKNLSSGDYQLTIVDAANCVFTDTFTITQMGDFSVRGELLPTDCEAETGGVRLEIDNAHPEVTYLYSITNSIYFFNSTFQNIQPGDYTLYAKTDDDCIDSTAFRIPFPESLYLELGDDYIVSLGDSVKLDAYNFDNRFVKFAWSPQAGLSCADCPQPTVSITEDTEFTLTVTDAAGCTTQDAVKVIVQKDRNIYVPSAFSPNADGVNDEFYIFGGEGVMALRDFKIYGRWGNLLHHVAGTFAANDFRTGWDGKIAGRRAGVGEYVYQFTAVFLDGNEILYQGIVKLVR